MTETELLDELVKDFAAKFGCDTEIEIEPVAMDRQKTGMFDIDTPYIRRIKVNSDKAEVPGLNVYVDFWGYGWTDDKNSRWYKERTEILRKYGSKVLAKALGYKIITRTDYTIKK